MIRQQFNNNWTFKKQGEAAGRVITLPHDAMLEEKRAQENATGSAGAYFGTGVYEYEKELEVPVEWSDKHVEIQFEGVYKNSKVYVNDVEVGGAAYGYIPYFVNLDGKVNYGAKNTIKVVADNSEAPNSRWYTGAGIYRPVWLWVGEKAHVLPEGIHVTTLSYDPAVIRVEVATSESTDMEIQICDGETVVATANKEAELTIPNAKLWSEDTPHLYTCKVALKKDGVVVDEAETTFGIRLVEWSNKGLLINGKNTLLRGGCVHHDNGILGAASYEESEYRRVKKLKEAGYNAIRASHNPAADAMLRACDEYGIYVMDESWDMWYNKKSKHDYANDFMDNYKADLEALVSRDYNHPSVIMYSIGNEVSEPAKEKGVALAKEINEALKGVETKCDVVIATPFTHLVPVVEAVDAARIGVGAENCADKAEGAFTGEVSAKMVASTGAQYVILGHSERRAYYGETAEILKEKVQLALATGLTPIFCIGEVLEERNQGIQNQVVFEQLAGSLYDLSAEDFSKIILAYEPVWAIGTGLTATPEQAEEIHAYIRSTIAEKYGNEVAENTSILYGGSCKPSNAKELFANPNVDGGLIGGAALKVADFKGIIDAFK